MKKISEDVLELKPFHFLLKELFIKRVEHYQIRFVLDGEVYSFAMVLTSLISLFIGIWKATITVDKC